MLEYCNWTQVPNKLLDEWFPKLKEAELRVFLIIIRFTIGFHRKEHPLSLTFLEKKTGMSRQGVINGIQDLLEKGIIQRRQHTDHPKTYIYSICFKETIDSQLSGLEMVNEDDSCMVNQVDTVKETEEKKKANNSIPLPPSKGKETPNPLKGAAAAASLDKRKEKLRKDLSGCLSDEDFEWGYDILLLKERTESIRNVEGLIIDSGRERWKKPSDEESVVSAIWFIRRVDEQTKHLQKDKHIELGATYISFPTANLYFKSTEIGFRSNVVARLAVMGVKFEEFDPIEN